MVQSVMAVGKYALATSQGDPVPRHVQGTNELIVAGLDSEVIEVTLSLDTLVYADGDVLADTQEIAAVFPYAGDTVRLDSVIIIDADNQGEPFDILLLADNVSLGTENAAPTISASDLLNTLAVIPVEATDFRNVGAVRVAQVTLPPAILKTSTTSLFIAGISRGAGTYTASGLTVKLGLLRV